MTDHAVSDAVSASTEPAVPAESVATPGQTIGPFFHTALPYTGGSLMVPPGHRDAIRLTGRVLDGAGGPIPDALVEVWQAGPAGNIIQQEGSLRRDGWTFTGWGRSDTDAHGRYSFSTVVPGRVPGTSARWFSLVIFARGLLNRLFTRAYLPDDELDPVSDPLLRSLDPDRRATLLAAATDDGYSFDIRLQGEAETVFLRFPNHAD